MWQYVVVLGGVTAIISWFYVVSERFRDASDRQLRDTPQETSLQAMSRVAELVEDEAPLHSLADAFDLIGEACEREGKAAEARAAYEDAADLRRQAARAPAASE